MTVFMMMYVPVFGKDTTRERLLDDQGGERKVVPFKEVPPNATKPGQLERKKVYRPKKYFTFSQADIDASNARRHRSLAAKKRRHAYAVQEDDARCDDCWIVCMFAVAVLYWLVNIVRMSLEAKEGPQ